MKHKIAVITTEFLVDYVRHAFSELNMNCTYELFTYKTFRDIPELLPKISKDVRGILTSGSFPARVIELSLSDNPYIIMPFNTDDKSICHLFLRLLDEDRTLNFDRISADVVTIHNIDLRSYLTKGISYSLAVTADELAKAKTLDELFEIENIMFQRHLDLWNSDQIDLCITRFSSLVAPLQAAGVNVCFPYPGVIYFNDVCNALFKEIEYRMMLDHSPASIAISVIPMSGSQELRHFSMDHHMRLLQNALTEFLGDSNPEYIFRRSDTALEIVTQHKNVHMLTKQGTICQIQNFLHKKARHKFFVGYGLGWDMEHACTNARNALQKARDSQESASYILRTDNHFEGPLLLTDETNNINTHLKSTCNFSAEKKYEVLSLIRTFQNEEFTSQELADKLQITKRSANRLLAAMLDDSMIDITRTQPTASRGRPERIYKVIK